MFHNNVVYFVLAATVSAPLLCLARGGEGLKARIFVTPPKAAPAGSKVGPGLHALAVIGGTLYGQTKTGSLIIEVPKNEVARAKEALTEIGAKVRTGLTAADAPRRARVLLVKYKDKEAALKELKELGYEVLDDYAPGSLLRVAPKEKGGQVQAAAISTLSKSPNLDHVQLEHILRIPTPIRKEMKVEAVKAGPPNDPFFKSLWAMPVIKALEAWKTIHDSTVTVAVLDSGVDYRHEDLKDNMWTNPKPDPKKKDLHGYNFVDNNGDPADKNDHGTHCAGTVGALGDNQKGVVGVNWKVKIMALRFLDANGQGSDFDAVRCIDYAIARPGVKVISASWGGNGVDQALYDAIKRARAEGVLFVAAAGNDGNDNDNPAEREFPCSYSIDNGTFKALDNIIVVMAVDKGDVVPDWSGYGKKSVDIAAPGVDILSCQPGNRYQAMDGTSMATPHVAGAAALVWSHPKYAKSDYKAIRKLLTDNARKVTGLKCSSGGVLNIGFLNAQAGKGGGTKTPPEQSLLPGERRDAGSGLPTASSARIEPQRPATGVSGRQAPGGAQ